MAQFKRTIVFWRDNYKVTINVFAHVQVPDILMDQAVNDWLKSMGKKKLKKTMEVSFHTVYGA